MAKAKKGKLTIEDALVPVEDQPYEIPENWCWTKLAPIVNIQTGKKDANYGCDDGEYYFFTCASEPIRCADYSYDCKAVLLAGNGDISNISIYEGKFEAYQRTYIVEAKNNILTEFLYYYFKYRWVDYNIDKMFGTAIPYIRLGNLNDFEIPIPPIEEQKRIVEQIENLFTKLDECIEKVSNVSVASLGRRKSIVNKAISGELLNKKIDIVSLNDIVSTIKIGPFGSSLHKEDYVEGEVPIINPKHINNQSILPDSKVTISKSKAEELASYKLLENDIIMGRRGEMGRCAPVSDKEEGYICGTGSLIIRLKEGYRADMYSQILGSPNTVAYLEQNSVGSTMNNLNEKIVKKIPVPNLSLEEQNTMMGVLESLLQKEDDVFDKIDGIVNTISYVKKSILAKAFRGELGTNIADEESSIELLKQIIEL